MRTEEGLTRRSRRTPVALALLLIGGSLALGAAANGADATLELGFRPDVAGGGVFSVSGKVDAPRGALVIVGISFDGQPVHGSWRRVEVAGDGFVRMTWLTRARVLPGEYEAVATVDSSRQPRAIRAFVPGAARSVRAIAYVGEPDADVGEEELARKNLLADASAIAALSKECVEAAPVTTVSDAAARTAKRNLLGRSDALLDGLERRIGQMLPPSVFAARLPDLHETLAMTIRTFREALRVEAWHAVDCGMEPPAFLEGTKRPQPPFVTLREVAVEAVRVQAELEGSRAGRAHGPRALEKLVRQTTGLAQDLGRADSSASEDEKRARKARRVRTQTLARELAVDAQASTIAGGGDTLKAIAVELEELAAAPEDRRLARRRALDARAEAIDARVTEERGRRRVEVEELVRVAQKLQEDVKRLTPVPSKGEDPAREERLAWRRAVEALRSAAAALPDRGSEFFPGVRSQLDLAARALLARDTADGLRASYLDGVIRDALAKTRNALPPGS